MQRFELLLAVDGPELRRERDIDHAGLHGVLAAEVAPVRFQQGADLIGGNLAVRGGQGQDLVSALLHGAGLVDVDVSAGGAHDALVRAELRGDDGGVGLRPADEEMDLGVRAAEHAADQVRGPGAMRVLSVAQGLLQVGLPERLENLRTAAFQVVAFETDHKKRSLLTKRKHSAR